MGGYKFTNGLRHLHFQHLGPMRLSAAHQELAGVKSSFTWSFNHLVSGHHSLSFLRSTTNSTPSIITMIDESTTFAGCTLALPSIEHNVWLQNIGADHAEDVIIGIREGTRRTC